MSRYAVSCYKRQFAVDICGLHVQDNVLEQRTIVVALNTPHLPIHV